MIKKYITLIVLLSSQTIYCQQAFISFNTITTESSCESTSFISRISSYIWFAKMPVQISFEASNLKKIELKYRDKTFPLGSSFWLKKAKDLESLFVSGVLEAVDNKPYIVLKQHVQGKSKLDTLYIRKGYFKISKESKIYRVSNSCLEEVTLAFPFAGTQTDLSLFEEIEGKTNRIHYQTYYCCYGGNEFSVKKSRTNKFLASLVGCHQNYRCKFELR